MLHVSYFFQYSVLMKTKLCENDCLFCSTANITLYVKWYCRTEGKLENICIDDVRVEIRKENFHIKFQM